MEVKSTAKFDTIVPSIHDPHPSIQLENLPRSLQPAVAGLRILELNLHEIFFVQTHCFLVKFSSLLPTQDFDPIILHFSIILGLIKAANQAPEKLGNKSLPVALQLKEMLIAVLPDLKKNSLKNWQEIQKEAQINRVMQNTGH